MAEGSADDIGVMGVSLKDVVKPRFGFQGETQGAGTPNQAGIGGFLPLKINDNSVWFVDALANVNFADFNAANSSLGGTVLDAFTVSTSTRLGYRWLNSDRSWMFGINAGYDSRPVKSGSTVSGYNIYDQQTPFFQQVAVSAEAIHKQWDFNAYALIPVGEYGLGSGNVAILNSLAGASPLTTFGLKVAYAITDNWKIGAGYYYELDEKSAPVYPDSSEGSGAQASLSYNINNQLEVGAIYSYDDYFQSRVSGNLTWRFNGSRAMSEATKSAVLQGLITKPGNRNVRVANSKRHYRYYVLKPATTHSMNAIASSVAGSVHVIHHNGAKPHHVHSIHPTSPSTSVNSGTTNSSNTGTASKGIIVDHGKHYHPADLDGKTTKAKHMKAFDDFVTLINHHCFKKNESLIMLEKESTPYCPF